MRRKRRFWVLDYDARVLWRKLRGNRRFAGVGHLTPVCLHAGFNRALSPQQHAGAQPERIRSTRLLDPRRNRGDWRGNKSRGNDYVMEFHVLSPSMCHVRMRTMATMHNPRMTQSSNDMTTSRRQG